MVTLDITIVFLQNVQAFLKFELGEATVVIDKHSFSEELIDKEIEKLYEMSELICKDLNVSITFSKVFDFNLYQDTHNFFKICFTITKEVLNNDNK